MKELQKKIKSAFADYNQTINNQKRQNEWESAATNLMLKLKLILELKETEINYELLIEKLVYERIDSRLNELTYDLRNEIETLENKLEEKSLELMKIKEYLTTYNIEK